VIRPVSPGDSLLVYRLQKHGQSLDLRRTLTESWSPLREAWLAFLTGQLRGQVTLVWRNVSGPEGVVQVRLTGRQAGARITYLAPRSEDVAAGEVWARLVEGACAEAGARGAPRVFAHTRGDGAELDVFQQLGFYQYARQTVFRLADNTLHQADEQGPPVRPWQPSDQWAAQRLSAAITPRSVRQAEGLEREPAGGVGEAGRLVLIQEGELKGVLTVYGGRLGYWLRILVHPESPADASALLQTGLSALSAGGERPAFCAVRHYEGHMLQPLADLGFEPMAEQALMVKQLAARVQAAVGEAVVSLKQGTEPATPALTHAAGEAER
jgi:hypothetical protein